MNTASASIHRALSLLILSNFAWTGMLGAAPLPADSKIVEVMVYSDRARVAREAVVNLPEGESAVAFSGLPANLDESSVQITGEGKGSKIRSFEIRNKFTEKTINDAIRKLQDDILALDDEKQKLQDQIGDLKNRGEFLKNMRDAIGEKLGKDVQTGKTDASQIKATYEFYSTELKQITEKTRTAQIVIRDIQPKREKLQQELDKIQGGTNRQEKEVLVYLDSHAGGAKLKLSYVMYGASWTPLYDARAHVDKGEIDLTYHANVSQRTGEDWNNVRISLSTARPQVGGRMPELDPWLVDVSVPMLAEPAAVSAPVKLRGAVEKKEAFLRQNSQIPGSAAISDTAMVNEFAGAQSRGVAIVFEVKSPMTVPGDGESHRSTLLAKSFKASFAYATTPKLSPSAYLKSRLANNTETPIMGGEVNLFLEDDFVGKSHVNFIAPAAEFDFYMGVDDDIKVKRKELVNKTERGGVFGMGKKMLSKRKYEIKVENYKKTGQSVTVLDQIPVSKNSEITVEGVKFSESPAKVNKETGILEWEIKLKPRESKTVTIEFEVSYPEGKEVVGL